VGEDERLFDPRGTSRHLQTDIRRRPDVNAKTPGPGVFGYVNIA